MKKDLKKFLKDIGLILLCIILPLVLIAGLSIGIESLYRYNHILYRIIFYTISGISFILILFSIYKSKYSSNVSDDKVEIYKFLTLVFLVH